MMEVKEFNSFHECLSSDDVRLTKEESAFSHGNQDKKRKHQNQVKRLAVSLSHVVSSLSFFLFFLLA